MGGTFRCVRCWPLRSGNNHPHPRIHTRVTDLWILWELYQKSIGSVNQTISHFSPFITSSEHLFLLPFKNASCCLLWQVSDLHSLGSIHLFGRSTVGMVESRDSQVNWIQLSFHVWFGGNIWTGWAQIIRHLPSDNPHISRLTQLYHMSTTFRPFNH